VLGPVWTYNAVLELGSKLEHKLAASGS